MTPQTMAPSPFQDYSSRQVQAGRISPLIFRTNTPIRPTPAVPMPLITPVSASAGMSSVFSQRKAKARQDLWRTSVNEPLAKIFQFFENKCIGCYYSGRPEYITHRSDNCGTKEMLGYDRAFVNFRDGIRLGEKMCYGCLTTTAKFGVHGVSVGRRECPHSGILTRMAYSYFVKALEEQYGIISDATAMVSIEEYQLWLCEEFKEEEDNYWPVGQRRYNIWILAIELAKASRVFK
ncbi:hypothetical protein B0H34DRAFT_736712 [Crassisporium funariophilum]|nr:hypothetical protein B0H34DRAFT_736712 [Crassisporium funariophilum]